MKRVVLFGILAVLALAPASALAMDNGKMDHGTMSHDKMDHDSMGHGDMAMLGSEVVDGVKATVMIKDTSEAMAKMGMDHTHHLMVNFAGEHNGTAIEKGRVAVKIVDPDEEESGPVKMMGMTGAFGADLVLKKKGMYHFYIGTLLEDGKKRQYHIHAEVK